MSHALICLSLLLAISVTTSPFRHQASAQRTTASRISPDGYSTNAEARPDVPYTFTLPDNTIATIYVNPRFSFVTNTTLEADASDLGSELVSRPIWVSGRDADTCGPSTFVGKTSRGSPRVRDCDTIREIYTTREHGYYRVWVTDHNFVTNDWTPVVTHGSCVFGIRDGDINGKLVGNTDIADIIRDSIARFGSGDGYVGAEGRMDCQHDSGDDLRMATDWAIFHA